MASVITLPRELTKKGEIVLLSRVKYDKLLRMVGRRVALDESIKEALDEAEKGKVSGPFKNSKDLIRSLA
ncbi:MAG: hypothetical protein PHU56_01280 [Candidatus Pacebacteria bacterium]|nr:hypothetical protein [Candidatus Paceibacterota bacterium]